MIGEFLLLIFALIIFLVIAPIGIIAGIFPKKNWLQKTKKYFAHITLSLDQHLNVIGRDLFNFLLIKNNGPDQFGKVDETISSVLGKNKLNNNLTRTGRLLDKILGKEHSIKAIEYDE